jgi:hypothetical protein
MLLKGTIGYAPVQTKNSSRVTGGQVAALPEASRWVRSIRIVGPIVGERAAVHSLSYVSSVCDSDGRTARWMGRNRRFRARLGASVASQLRGVVEIVWIASPTVIELGLSVFIEDSRFADSEG